MKKLTGMNAVEYKINNPDAELNKYSDPTEEERFDVTVEYAEEVIREDESLIYVEID